MFNKILLIVFPIIQYNISLLPMNLFLFNRIMIKLRNRLEQYTLRYYIKINIESGENSS